jgi:hypothetical protein
MAQEVLKGKVKIRIPPRFPLPSSAFPQIHSPKRLAPQAFSAICFAVNIFQWNESRTAPHGVIRIVDFFF